MFKEIFCFCLVLVCISALPAPSHMDPVDMAEDAGDKAMDMFDKGLDKAKNMMGDAFKMGKDAVGDVSDMAHRHRRAIEAVQLLKDMASASSS